MLRALAPDLWVVPHRLKLYGTPIVTRMTVVRLADGGLFLHGPVPRTPELAREIGEVGPVRAVVAPNRYHHLWAGEWSAPGVRLHGAPGLAAKRRDLSFDAVLGSEPDEAWRGQIDQEVLAGLPIVHEVVFLHRASRTLIVTDLFFNYPPTRSLLVRAFRLLEDCDGKFTVPRVVRLLARDRAFRRSLDKILAWDFDRVIMAHGDVVDTTGKARARIALERWIS